MQQFLEAKPFKSFPIWKTINYVKDAAPKILKFEVFDGEKSQNLYLSSIVSRDEKTAWQSFQDTIENLIKISSGSVRGFFGLQILCVDIYEGMRNFNPSDFSKLIINHSKTIPAGERTLVRYGQLYALLHYRAPAEWGKIELKTYVDFCDLPKSLGDAWNEESVRAALLGKRAPASKKSDSEGIFPCVKNIIKEARGNAEDIAIICDMSKEPLWDLSNKDAREKVFLWLDKEKAKSAEPLPKLYYFHSDKLIMIGRE